MDTIYFYSRNKEYYQFSNFANYPIDLDGKLWPTSEHYYQAQKFVNTDPQYAETIRLSAKPRDAFNLGRRRTHPMRHDWDKVKDDVMYRAIYAKFTQHLDLKELLLSTGDRNLVEDSPYDSYWGIGRDGKGLNKLGELLMILRDELRSE